MLLKKLFNFYIAHTNNLAVNNCFLLLFAFTFNPHIRHELAPLITDIHSNICKRVVGNHTILFLQPTSD